MYWTGSGRGPDRLVDRLDPILGGGEVRTSSWTSSLIFSGVEDGCGTRTAATTQKISLAGSVKHRGRWREERGRPGQGRP